MDLCTRRASADTFEYRHKKFDHVRSSPITVEHRRASTPALKEETSSIYGNRIKRQLEENDSTWEPSADDIELLHTPTKRRKQSRSSRTKRNASYELCNAPKKHKPSQYVALASTPEKHTERVQITSSLMPEISKEALARICQYNKNMIRKFPKKERTAKDQERRDKNTIACRMSRRLKKLENLAVEEQYKILIQEYLGQSKQVMHAAVYLNELIKFGGKVAANEQNEEIAESIAKKLGLHYLESISNSADRKELALIDRNHFQADKWEEDKLPHQHVEKNPFIEDKPNVQRKRKFSIAFILGRE